MTSGTANIKGAKVDYSGVRFAFCCGGCDGTFTKEPTKFFTGKDTKGKVFGYSLFDPVSMKPIESKNAKGYSDYLGVRYYFASTDNKATFDQDMKKFGTMPKKECMVCPVSGEKIESYAKAGGYADFEGVRYYFCCPNCSGGFSKDSASFAEKNKSNISAPKALAVKE